MTMRDQWLYVVMTQVWHKNAPMGDAAMDCDSSVVHTNAESYDSSQRICKSSDLSKSVAFGLFCHKGTS